MSSGGFTILEVIVVIFIVSLSLIGVLSLVTQTIQVQYVNKSALIASQLAQEGLELVRNKRDTNWISGAAYWYSGLADAQATYTYKIDNSAITSVAGMSQAGLNIDTSGYTHQAGTPSIFSRLITIIRSDENSLTASCRVYWTERGNTHNYIAETVLYDWK